MSHARTVFVRSDGDHALVVHQQRDFVVRVRRDAQFPHLHLRFERNHNI